MEISVRFEISPLLSRIRAAQGQLQQDRLDLMRSVGVQLLTLAQQSYRAKARGQRGEDGIEWRPLKRSTIKARVLQRAPGRRIVAERKSLARQIRQLLGTRPKRKKGGTRRRGGIGARAATRRRRIGQLRRRSPVRAIRRALRKMPKPGKGKTLKDQILKLRRRRLELLLKLENLVDRELAKHEIGVNTGLQRASASPGFKDAAGGNVFNVAAGAVTIGFGRKYSVHFDAARPLLPETLPAPWQEKVESVALRWAEGIASRALQ